jgi:hypothetical protein
VNQTNPCVIDNAHTLQNLRNSTRSSSSLALHFASRLPLVHAFEDTNFLNSALVSETAFLARSFLLTGFGLTDWFCSTSNK